MGQRIAIALAGALVVAAGWAAAPAISLGPYQPAAIDFEQRLPALERAASAVEGRASHHGDGGDRDDGHSDEPPVRWVSPVIRAPKRFDVAGVAGHLEPLEYRVRRSGDDWSRWTEVDSGDPVWAGGADTLQVRSRYKRPKGSIHYVNVSGTATAAARALTRVRQSVNAAVASMGWLGSASAQNGGVEGTQPPDGTGDGTAPGRPPIVSRRAWGADSSCRPRSSPAYGKVRASIVHHTVSANNYSREAAPRVVLAICRFHRNGNGWTDIGYNALVDKYGGLYEGRAGGLTEAVVGAHAQGYNSQTTGVASIGTHSSVPLSNPAMGSLARYLGWKLSIHRVPARGWTTVVSQGGGANRYPAGRRVSIRRISGHRDVNSTACPGGSLHGQLATLRARAKTAFGKAAAVTMLIRPGATHYREPATISGRVVTSDTGVAYVNAPVTIQLLSSKGRWRRFGTAHTDGAGNYSFDTVLSSNRWFRARMQAHDEYAAGHSQRERLLVRAAVRARLSRHSTLRDGGRAVIRGTVRPHKRKLVVAVMRSSRGKYHRVGRIETRARNGRWRISYRFSRPGRYKFRSVFKRDRLNASGRADDIDVTVPENSGGVSSRR